MTSVPPHRIRVPMLLGGPHAEAILPLLDALGFAAKVASAKLGVASATKMCRSVMIKGLEAMVVESFIAARAYGVEDSVLASLAETFPGIDWERQGTYFFQRVIQHGRRRAEEMVEAAETVREIGLEPWSAAGHGEAPGVHRRFGRCRRAGRSPRRAHRLAPRCRPRSRGASPARAEQRLLRRALDHGSRLPSLPSHPLAAAVRRAARRGGRPLSRVRSGVAQFPYAPERKYTPCDAPKEKLFALRDFLGFERNVIVQATCHGNDNRALVDALAHSDGRARGVASVGRDVTDAELEGDARRRRARHALQLRPPARRFHAARGAVRHRPPDRAARVARGRVFRGAGPARAVGLLHDAPHRRSSSITWAAPMSASRSTGRSSNCSSSS